MPDEVRDNGGKITTVTCGTTTGPVTMEFHRNWSPLGYDRVVALFGRHYYDSTHFFRVLPHFLVQFGITYSTDKDLTKFANTAIPDDPQLNPKIEFDEGIISFAGSGPNSRSSQIFIAYAKVGSLGTQKWETPIGRVIDGMENVHNFNHDYGEKPKQHKIRNKGSAYIDENFPLLDRFKSCKVNEVDTDVVTAKQKHYVKGESVEDHGEKGEVKDAHLEAPRAIRKREISPVRKKRNPLRNIGVAMSEPNDMTAFLAALPVFLVAMIILCVNGMRRNVRNKTL